MLDEKNDLSVEVQEEDNTLSYEAMSLEDLTKALKKLLETDRIQAIRGEVNAIRKEFDAKYEMLVEEKREEYLADGGEDYDFKYESPIHKEFYALLKEYRERFSELHKEMEKQHKENLTQRREIIEELKNLINVEENIGTTFKQFKELQERWRNAGPVSKADYEDLWNNYHHHVERFYDYIHLSKDLRDIDFKRNLEEKEKLIARAEELLSDEVDGLKAARELQQLHRTWKEELGPVDKEHRESIWERFTQLSKQIRDKQQEYLKNLDKIFEENLAKKKSIIEKMNTLAAKEPTTHNGWKQLSKEMQTLRESYFNAGRVPEKEADTVWTNFKAAFRIFDKKKNHFYKATKKEQQENLVKKLALVEIAKANQDSTDWEVTTELMKKIQREWKEIGAVPIKNSEKIWKEFKKACDNYFNHYGEAVKANKDREFSSLDRKKELLDELKAYQLGSDKDKNIADLQEYARRWDELGRTPHSKKSIDIKFHKIIDGLLKKLDFDKQEIEIMKYNNKLERLINDDNENSLNNEVIYVKRRIEEIKSEVLQLENNLSFFGKIDEKNPLIKEVLKNINNQKENLLTWENKLRELKNLQKSQQAEENTAAEEEKV